ncbi:MAG: DnaJ family domain-containing protein [Pyrinomonadaceae bacterium]
MNRLESMAEKMLREAIEAGEFDDLPGKGEPVDLSENPFEDPDLRVVHKLLREAGFAPAWIEERKDIDAVFETARDTLTRAWKIYRPGGISPNDAAWERNVSEFCEKVAELNSRIRLYNLKVPAAVFQRRLFDADKVIEGTTQAQDSG